MAPTMDFFMVSTPIARRWRRFVASSVALSLVLCGQALAQPAPDNAKQEAKARFVSGQSHYNLNEFAEALADFKDAYRLFPDPVFLYNLGQCEKQLGHFDEAIRFYRSYLREETKAPNRQEVLHKIDEMEAALESRPTAPEKTPPGEPSQAASAEAALAPAPAQSSVAVEADRPSVTGAAPATVGERPLPSPAPPAPPSSARVDLTAAPLAPAAPAPAFYRRWWFWTAAAVVVAGAGIAIYAASARGGNAAPSTALGTKRVF